MTDAPLDLTEEQLQQLSSWMSEQLWYSGTDWQERASQMVTAMNKARGVTEKVKTITIEVHDSAHDVCTEETQKQCCGAGNCEQGYNLDTDDLEIVVVVRDGIKEFSSELNGGIKIIAMSESVEVQ